ncbi:hypothetical protein P8631_08265 [Guyparkeria sp. 1SP6A2]|nr:hypothetical protein [Guyparkeria sp. 1SP6A2]
MAIHNIEIAGYFDRLATLLEIEGAHAEGQLSFMRFGINQARRGWLSADDVINTRDLAGLRRLIQ